MKALDNRFYVKFIQLEIGLLAASGSQWSAASSSQWSGIPF